MPIRSTCSARRVRHRSQAEAHSGRERRLQTSTAEAGDALETYWESEGHEENMHQTVYDVNKELLDRSKKKQHVV